MSVQFYARGLVVSLLFFNVGLAAGDETFSEQDYFSDLSQIVSATRIPQRPEEAPVSITIIDRKMIEASSAIEIVDLFRLVPGMRVTHVVGSVFIVAYHGHISDSPKSMQVLIDGRSVFTPLFNIVDWANLGLTINDIERIEVIRGPNSAAYGANAVRGTINIITRKPFQVEGQTVELTAGAIGTRNGMYRFAKVNDNFEYRVTLSTKQDDGFDTVDDYKNLKSLAYRGIYTSGNNTEFDLQLGLSSGPTGGRGVDTDPEKPPREKDTRGHYQSLTWSRNLKNDINQKLNFSNNYILWDDSYTVYLPDIDPGLPADFVSNAINAGEATTTEIEFQQSHSGDEGLRLVWGGSYKLDRARQAIILDRPDYISVASQRVFAHVENRINDATILHAGLMAENNGLVGFYVSPRLALNYIFSSSHAFRISASQNKRTPSLFEYYNNHTVRLQGDDSVFLFLAKSDPSLKEETLTNYELGYIGHFVDHRLLIDAKIYYEKFEDLIRNVSDPLGNAPLPFGTDYWMNSGYTTTRGGELQLKFTSKNGWSADAQYAYSEQTGELLQFTNPDAYYSAIGVNKAAGLVPRRSYSLLLSKQLPGQWQASIGQYFTSKMEWFGGEVIEDIRRTDIKLSKTFTARARSGRVSLVVQNIGDDYFEYENKFDDDPPRLPNLFDTRTYLQFEVNY